MQQGLAAFEISSTKVFTTVFYFVFKMSNCSYTLLLKSACYNGLHLNLHHPDVVNGSILTVLCLQTSIACRLHVYHQPLCSYQIPFQSCQTSLLRSPATQGVSLGLTNIKTSRALQNFQLAQKCDNNRFFESLK